LGYLGRVLLWSSLMVRTNFSFAVCPLVLGTMLTTSNYWVLCLQNSDSSSVMFDMAPGYGSSGLRGKIEVSHLEKYTGETLHVFTYQPLQTVDVDVFMGFVCENRRDAFTFSPEWEGCRFWLTVVMRDLEDAGWLEKDSADQAKEALQMYWRNPEGSEPRAMREGRCIREVAW